MQVANAQSRMANQAGSEWRMANRAPAKPSSLLAAGHSPAEARARKTAEDYESMFLEQSLGHMFATTGGEGPLGDSGTGSEVYRSMLVKEYAGTIARSGGVGIADQIYREIIKLQEGGDAKRV
jgi:Rod binding domain-containing protein